MHKANLSIAEMNSLLACTNILKEEDIYILKPKQLNVTTYLSINKNLKVCEVPDAWLKSWDSYNLMKRSLAFYLLFKQYDFMLTYELDCLIFSNNWEKANSFNYDFIGAPWFEFETDSNVNKEFNTTFKSGLNSGFSLRNIPKCIAILTAIHKMKSAWAIFSFLNLHRVFNFSMLLSLFDTLWKTGPNVWFYTLTDVKPIHEDYFWTVVIPKLFHFKVAPAEDALKFSFEVNAAYLYHLNNNELPIGCHAWEKYEPQFWKAFILASSI